MQKLTYLLLSFFFLACGSSSISPDPAASELVSKDGFDEAKMDTIVKYAKVFPNESQLAFAIIQDSNVYFYGVKREQDKLLNIENADAVFEIGSISKVFTSVLLAKAVEAQKITLDQPIDQVLGFQLKDNTSITFQQLANHTSGLPRIPSAIMWKAMMRSKNPYKDFDGKGLDTYLKDDMNLKSKPGEKESYSNLGVGLLGYTLGKLYGQSYEQMLQTQIFQSMSMTSSTTDKNLIASKLVGGRNEEGKPTPNWDFIALAGAGAILSSVEDLSKFAFANFDSTQQALALPRKPTFTINPTMDIGLGWHIITTENQETLYWHNGGTGGYRSSMAINVDKQTAVIILSNVSSFFNKSGNIDQLCFRLMSIVDPSS